MMHHAVYLLCTGASFTCAFLLFRRFILDRSPLLLWCTVCFFGLTLTNVLLFVDMIILPPEVGLGFARNLVTLLSLFALLIGLIWNLV